jgi:hypothetical protein
VYTAPTTGLSPRHGWKRSPGTALMQRRISRRGAAPLLGRILFPDYAATGAGTLMSVRQSRMGRVRIYDLNLGNHLCFRRDQKLRLRLQRFSPSGGVSLAACEFGLLRGSAATRFI